MTMRLVIIWMTLGVLAAFGLYAVKYRVQALKLEVASTETQLREENKNLHVLTAEWAYLNRPERLHQLAARYLNIKPVHGNQLADVASLPEDGVIHAAQPVMGIPRHMPLAKGMTLAGGAFHAQ